MQTLRRMGEQSAGLVGQVADEMICSAGAGQEVRALAPSCIVNSGKWSGVEEPAVDYEQHRVAEENWLDDWHQHSYDAVTYTRRSTSHDEMKGSSEAVKEEEGKWVWNGGDFVWICGSSNNSTHTAKLVAPESVQRAFPVASIEDTAVVIDADADGAPTTESLGDELVVLRRRRRMMRL